MPDGFCRSFFDLRLDLSRRCGLVHDDPELVALDEEAACLLRTVGVQGNRLDRDIADMAADDDSDNAEQASRKPSRILGIDVGVVLHEP